MIFIFQADQYKTLFRCFEYKMLRMHICEDTSSVRWRLRLSNVLQIPGFEPRCIHSKEAIRVRFV